MVTSSTLTFPINGTQNCLIGTVFCPYNSLLTNKTILVQAPVNIIFTANKYSGNSAALLITPGTISNPSTLTCNVYKTNNSGTSLAGTSSCFLYSGNLYPRGFITNTGYIPFSFEQYVYNIATSFTATTNTPLEGDTYTFYVPISYTFGGSSSFTIANTSTVKHGLIIGSSVTLSSSLNSAWYGTNTDTLGYATASITAENDLISFIDNGTKKASIGADGRLMSNGLNIPINTTPFIGGVGLLPSASGSGTTIGWNIQSGTGETDFINGSGSGDGGFNFYIGGGTSQAALRYQMSGITFINYNTNGGGAVRTITAPGAGVYIYTMGANFGDMNITTTTFVSSGGGSTRLFNQYIPPGFGLTLTAGSNGSFTISASYPSNYNNFSVQYVKIA